MKVTIIQENERTVGVVFGYVSEEYHRIRQELQKAQDSSQSQQHSANAQSSPAPTCAIPMPGPDQLFFELEVPDEVQTLADHLLCAELDHCLRKAKINPCSYPSLF